MTEELVQVTAIEFGACLSERAAVYDGFFLAAAGPCMIQGSSDTMRQIFFSFLNRNAYYTK